MNPQTLEGLKRLIPLMIVGIAGIITNNIGLLALDTQTAFIVVTVVGAVSAIAWSFSDNARARSFNVKPSDVGYNEVQAFTHSARRVKL